MESKDLKSTGFKTHLKCRSSDAAVKFTPFASAAQGSLVQILGADLLTAHQAMLRLRATQKSDNSTTVTHNYALGLWGEKRKKRKIGNRC